MKHKKIDWDIVNHYDKLILNPEWLDMLSKEEFKDMIIRLLKMLRKLAKSDLDYFRRNIEYEEKYNER